MHFNPLQQSASRRVMRAKVAQRGSVMLVSLILLLVMTVLALSMSGTTTLEERMAGNARDADLAFQSAEAGLRGGESRLNASSVIQTCADMSTCQSTDQYYFNGVDFTQQGDSWWGTNGIEYGVAGTQEITQVISDPLYVVTVRGKKSDSLTVNPGNSFSKITYYEITSRSHGKTDTSEAVTQSIYAKRTLN